jgi:hypothetical protein
LIRGESSTFYNADKVVVENNTKFELALLETTDALNILNEPKETKDYVKASYGLVAMLHSIGRKYLYGDFEFFKKNRCIFLTSNTYVVTFVFGIRINLFINLL